MKNPNKQFALVVWDDAFTSDDEVEEHSIDHTPSRVNSYGWILRSDNIGITIAAEWGVDDGKYRIVTFVPRAMVVEEIPLTFTKKRRTTPKAEGAALEAV